MGHIQLQLHPNICLQNLGIDVLKGVREDSHLGLLSHDMLLEVTGNVLDQEVLALKVSRDLDS